jgi:hypothetical protein
MINIISYDLFNSSGNNSRKIVARYFDVIILDRETIKQLHVFTSFIFSGQYPEKTDVHQKTYITVSDNTCTTIDFFIRTGLRNFFYRLSKPLTEIVNILHPSGEHSKWSYNYLHCSQKTMK